MASSNFNEIFSKLQQSSEDSAKKLSNNSLKAVSQDPEKKKSTTDVSILSDMSLSSLYFNQFLMKECGKLVSVSNEATIFVDGENQREPIENLKQARFTDEIHSNLFRRGYQTAFKIQAYSWNSLCEGRAATIIGQRKSGKTLTYLLPILTLLSDINLDEECSEGSFALILASSSKKVDYIYDLCRDFVHLGKTTVLKASGKWNLQEVQMKLLNGCHLLITTVPCFIRLSTATADGVKVFNRQKLNHLVFDNVDDMIEKYQAQVVEVIKICTFGPDHANKNPQILITSTKWSDFIAKMLTLSCFPLTVISDHVEAAIYAKSRFLISRVSDKKDQLISRLGSGEYRSQRTIVFVNYEHELEGIKKLCSANMIEFIALSAKTKTSIDEVWEKNRGYMKVILASDDALIEYSIKNAQIIIHYTLPRTWTIFSKRFSSSFKHYKTYLALKKEDPKMQPMAMVMMDMNNVMEIPRMISLLRDRRLLANPNQISEETLKFVDEITEAIERSKVDPTRQTPVEICSNTLKFVKCSSYKCAKRHALIKEVDTPQFLPTRGQVKFSLVAVKNPIHYSIKIHEIRASEGDQWMSWKKRNESIEEELTVMQEILQDPENVMIQATIGVGDICAYFLHRQKKWFRAKVMSKENSESSNVLEIRRGRIHLIDKGEMILVQLTQLMKLEKRFQELPPLVYDLRIFNLVPYDCDTHFDNSIIREIDHMFDKKKNQGDVTVAQIAVTVQNTIFTKNFHVVKNLVNIGTYTVVMHLKEVLLRKDLAVEDKKIYENFKRLALSAGLEVPDDKQSGVNASKEIMKPPKNPHTDVVTTTIHLRPKDTYNVCVEAFKSPEMFYAMISEQYEKIQKVLRNVGTKKLLRCINVGYYCLYIADTSKEKVAYRATIRNVQKLEIFLLDTGCLIQCYKSELYEISKELLDLPFAAVKCKLSGVKPKNNKTAWDERNLAAFKHLINHLSTDRLYSMTVMRQISQGHFEVTLASKVGKKDLAMAAIKAKYAEREVSLTERQEELSSKLLKLLQEDETLFGVESELMKMIGLPETTKVIPAIESQPKNSVTTQIEEVQIYQSNSEKKMENFLIPNVPKAAHKKGKLTQLYQHPHIDWYQKGALIYLKVEFREGLDYSLDITETTLSVYLMYEKVKKCAHLDLYGSIKTKLASHSRVNENEILIRLVKRSMNVEWPFLISGKEKNKFIVFRDEELPKEIQTVKRNWYPADFYDDEDSAGGEFNPFDDQLNAVGII